VTNARADLPRKPCSIADGEGRRSRSAEFSINRDVRELLTAELLAYLAAAPQTERGDAAQSELDQLDS
jgi:hypothetical protein